MRKPSGLWAHRDFLKLWGAQTISIVGTQVTLIALPLTAILVLDASTFEVAALTAMDTLPFLLFALPAGIWIDRMRRRPLMVAAEAGRAAALLSIPVAYLLDALTLPHLFAAGFLVGALAVVFDLAYLSFLPGLVGRERVTGGNARMEGTRAGAQAAGPGLGGALVGLFGAPIAILADAVSYVASAVLIGSIRHAEPAPGPTIVVTSMLATISWLTVPLAPVSNPRPLLITGALLGPLFGTMFNLNQLSLRQAITPERLMGRMNAVVRFMYWGTMPLGSLAGGALGTLIGVRPTLFVGIVGGTLAFAPLAATSLMRLRAIPAEEAELELEPPALPVHA